MGHHLRPVEGRRHDGPARKGGEGGRSSGFRAASTGRDSELGDSAFIGDPKSNTIVRSTRTIGQETVPIPRETVNSSSRRTGTVGSRRCQRIFPTWRLFDCDLRRAATCVTGSSRGSHDRCLHSSWTPTGPKRTLSSRGRTRSTPRFPLHIREQLEHGRNFSEAIRRRPTFLQPAARERGNVGEPEPG